MLPQYASRVLRGVGENPRERDKVRSTFTCKNDAPTVPADSRHLRTAIRAYRNLCYLCMLCMESYRRVDRREIQSAFVYV